MTNKENNIVHLSSGFTTSEILDGNILVTGRFMAPNLKRVNGELHIESGNDVIISFPELTHVGSLFIRGECEIQFPKLESVERIIELSRVEQDRTTSMPILTKAPSLIQIWKGNRLEVPRLTEAVGIGVEGDIYAPRLKKLHSLHAKTDISLPALSHTNILYLFLDDKNKIELPKLTEVSKETLIGPKSPFSDEHIKPIHIQLPSLRKFRGLAIIQKSIHLEALELERANELSLGEGTVLLAPKLGTVTLFATQNSSRFIKQLPKRDASIRYYAEEHSIEKPNNNTTSKSRKR